MKLDSKYFDSIRVRPGRDRRKPVNLPPCQWAGCEQPGTHPAPQGRGREGLYFKFCLDHVQAYNKSYNYFQGMSDTDVEAYQKSAITGHRPTWKVGENGQSPGADPAVRRFERARSRLDRANPFAMFGDEGDETPQPDAGRRHLGVMAKRSLRALNLDDQAEKSEIKQRFKELVKRHHPDVNGGDRGSEERLREIIQAYNYLKQAGLC